MYYYDGLQDQFYDELDCYYDDMLSTSAFRSPSPSRPTFTGPSVPPPHRGWGAVTGVVPGPPRVGVVTSVPVPAFAGPSVPPPRGGWGAVAGVVPVPRAGVVTSVPGPTFLGASVPEPGGGGWRELTGVVPVQRVGVVTSHPETGRRQHQIGFTD